MQKCAGAVDDIAVNEHFYQVCVSCSLCLHHSTSASQVWQMFASMIWGKYYALYVTHSGQAEVRETQLDSMRRFDLKTTLPCLRWVGPRGNREVAALNVVGL